ncbi:MAG: 3-hydroxyacyl-ACP dehydratase FabZ [Rickettsiales bacterium]|nr:3-hydroxyacyl-ACP dehydratase FabZ [Rickettsiales bacterium]
MKISYPFVIDESLHSIDHERIKEMIPHRYPFLMVDRVVNMVDSESATGIKNVTSNEPFFVGHFPNQAVMPGVMMIESMAQTSALLVVHSMGKHAEGKLVYFMSIDEAKFRKPVVPGDRLHVHVETQQSRKNVWRFAGACYVEGVKVSEAVYSAMILDK